MTGPKKLQPAEAEQARDAGGAGPLSSGQAVVGASSEEPSGAGDLPGDHRAADEVWMEGTTPSRGPDSAWPAAAGLAVAAWTAFFIWAHRQVIFGGASAGQWSTLIVDWSIPVLLVIAIWLLAMRQPGREAGRFAGVARTLASESAALEDRLVTVNRELSLARDFIAARSHDLDSLGRVAVENISANADRLQDLIRDNSKQVDSIARVSETAVGNMDRLRDQLPVISNAARDMTSQIGNAGNTAQAQIDKLHAGFERLGEAGEANNERVVALRTMLEETLETLQARGDDFDRLAEKRFELLRKRGADFALELETREKDNLSAIRRRADELGKELSAQDITMRTRAGEATDALHARITALRENSAQLSGELDKGYRDAAGNWARAITELEERMREAFARVTDLDESAIANARARLAAFHDEVERMDGSTAERLRTLDDEMARRRDEQLAHVATFAERTEALAARVAEVDRQLTDVAQQSGHTSDALGVAADRLAKRLSGSREMLSESGEAIGRLTDGSVRLLELIRASSEHTTEDLPRAIGAAQDKLAAYEQRANALRDSIADAEAKGAALANLLERTGGTKSLEALDALDRRLGSVAEQTGALAEKARHDAEEAVAALESASEGMLGRLRDGQEAAVRDLAESIGERSRDAIAKSLHESTERAIGELEKAAREAGQAGRETASQLREQLAAVNELTGHLEARVAQARSELHEAAESDLPSNMAKITERLKSDAVDISRIFEADVPEKDWAGYVNADQDFFARRAVRLLSNKEVREVHELYEQDDAFRGTVNRYIQDFETMLRTVLTARQGNAIAITLLSSDIGKLYVALAQGIERLRT